ncbi:MAG: RICIN domain-containing protein [Pseudomonadota bacterium]
MTTRVFWAFVGLTAVALWTNVSPALGETTYKGRMALVGKLDEPDGLCLDLPGPPFMLMLDRPAWVHTCKPGDFSDMVFQFNGSSVSAIRSDLVNPALCLNADEVAEGSLLHFVECKNDSAEQLFRHMASGQILLASTASAELSLCLSARTAASAPPGEPPNNEDTDGHSMIVNLERSHVARVLELRNCKSVSLEVSQWEAYEERKPRPFN